MDVAFAVMPFADVARPAIGVSLLKAELARRGLEAKIFYFNVLLAEWLGHDLYTFISNRTPSDAMVGEWFFADLVFPNQLPAEHEFVRNVLAPVTPPDVVRDVLDGRRRRAELIDRAAEALAATHAPIVGFTTTFHQTCACLAVARRLKELPNPPLVAFGGANCEGEMGLQMIRSCPWIDYVCTREGDLVFPEFVERFVKYGERSSAAGLLSRSDDELTVPPMVEAMDALPIPDYDDYVETVAASALDGVVKREMQIETARGCWWGAKHHCTFCGLNGDTMPYRSKSPERVYEELRYLRQRYGFKRIDSVDNILDHRYISSVFPRLADEGIDLEMFYEVKANLRREQLVDMKRGGITIIQPGIESFSSGVLQLMKKGVTGFQNVQLLRWAEEVGIVPAWNLLAGFPGELPAEYDRMADLLPLLTHLEPPTGCSPIRLDRFSPLFNCAEASGLRRVRPTLAYYYVFPFNRRELERLAYFFDFDYADGRKPETYVRNLQAAVTRWRDARFAGEAGTAPVHRLDACFDADGVTVTDSRACAVAAEHRLTGAAADVLEVCDTARMLPALVRLLAAQGHAAADVEDAMARLLDAKLATLLDDHVLSLPVFRRRRIADKVRTNVIPLLNQAPHPEQLLHLR